MSNGQVWMCRESAMVPVEDEDGNEVPTLFTKGKTTIREGHELLDRFGEFFEPLKVDYEVDDGEPEGKSGGVGAAIKKAVGKKAAAKPTPAAKKAAAQKVAESNKGTTAAPVSDKDLKSKDVPTPPAGHVPNPDPAGKSGPEGGIGKGTEASALTDDPKLV